MRIFFGIFIVAAVLCSEARVLKDTEEKNRVFTNMRAGLEASKDILNAIETVLEAMDAASSQGSGRHLASTKGSKKGKKSKKSKSSSCEKELQQCKAAAAEPKALFIQTGNECRIERDGENNYKLVSDVGNETFLFLDRPRRFEDMVPTKAVIDDFGMLFGSSDPNIGVTLVSKDTDELLNPLVVIGSNPTITGDSVVCYDIEQSESQESVIPLESLFEEGMDSVSFKDCSFFIDAAKPQDSGCSTGSGKWHVDWSNMRCIQGGSECQWNTVFDSASECCSQHLPWISIAECIGTAVDTDSRENNDLVRHVPDEK